MSSSKTESSTNKHQKNPNPDIKIEYYGNHCRLETGATIEIDEDRLHDPNVIKKDVKNPLRIRLEYK